MRPTALDAPLSALDPDEVKFVTQLRENGWFNTQVSAESDLAGFSYSTGSELNRGIAEVITFSLAHQVAHDLLWHLYRTASARTGFPLGQRVSNILDQYDVMFFAVGKRYYPEHLGWSRWFYGGDHFSCLQLVWPDKAGVFPWEPSFDKKFANDQPDLSEGGWLAEIAH